jgi:hypothetical protein
MSTKPIYKVHPKINWDNFSVNPNPLIIPVLEQHKEHINWNRFSEFNPNSFDLISMHLHDNAFWDQIFQEHNLSLNRILCRCRSEKAMKIIETKVDELNYECWLALSLNPFAFDVLKTNIEKIHWFALACNYNEKNIDLIFEHYPYFTSRNPFWVQISGNPGAINHLKKNKNKIDVTRLCFNPVASDLLEYYYNKGTVLYKGAICSNPGALNIIEKYDSFTQSEFNELCKNPNALHIIKKHQHQHDSNIIWWYLSKNTNSKAIEMIEENIDQLSNWERLSENPAAFHLLVSYDWKQMKINNEIFQKELCEYVFNPFRICRLSLVYNVEFSEYLEMI